MMNRILLYVQVVFLLLAALSGSAQGSAVAPEVGSTPGLRAYWNLNARSSDSVGHVDWEIYDEVTQVEQINFSRSNGAFYAGGPTDYFAARFVGQLDVPADGIWTIRMDSDQSALLLIDGQVVIDDNRGHSYRARTTILTLTAGKHDFEVRYWEGWSDAGLVMMWDGPGTDGTEIIPASAYSSPADEPVYDQGGDGLWAYWFDHTSHASNVGQIDWASPDRTETVQRPSYRKTRGAFRVDGPSDYFAARFYGIITLDEGGLWGFHLGSDQSAVLLIDGEPVVVDEQGHSFRWRGGSKQLSAGEHIFEVRYWEGWSDAGLHVAWVPPGESTPQVIPSSAFKPGDGAPIVESGGGLSAYRYDQARHASNVGQIEWDNHDSIETVQNVYYPKTRGSFVTNGPSDYFAMRFVGKIDIPVQGNWRFGLGSDQSARIYIDGRLVVDDKAGHSFRWRAGTVSLTPGEHDIEIQYWEGWSDAGLVVTWKGPRDSFEQVIPASAFSQPDAPEDVAGGNGLRVYWVNNARHAQGVGHIDWQNYDAVTYEANLAWGITRDPFEGTTIIQRSGDNGELQYSTSPGGTRSDYFGLRADGFIEIPKSGRWSFGIGSDQSAQLYINNRLVIDDSTGHSFRWRSGTIELEPGLYPFEVRYWEGWSDSGLLVSWTPPGGVEEVIPPSAFSHNEIETPYDSGGGGLRAYWTTNARHAGNAGQIDWDEHDHTTTVSNIAWRITRGQFDNQTPSDYFGVRLLGQIDVPASGLWTFSMGSDQSGILFIDDEPVVIDASGHSYRWRSGNVQLSAGKHDIEVRYWEGWSDAGLHLAWKGPTVPSTIIVPRSAFSLRETEAPSETGGGLRAYWTSSARHASNAGQIDYAEHSSTSIVDNVSWKKTRSAFYTGGPSDYFGLRLISRITIPQAGNWTFNLGSDQSAILLIDDEPVVVDTAGHSYRWRGGSMELTPGEHKFEVRYWEGWSDAGLHVTWKAPDAGFEEIIPASAFNAYDTDPVYDPGEAAITTAWFGGTRGYSLDSYPWDNPIKTTTEPRISWNITRSAMSDGVPSDYFAIRATGTLDVPRDGVWTFRVGSDQYARVLIDGVAVVSDTQGHSYRWRGGEVSLTAGGHELVVEFMDGWSDAGLFLTWQGPGDLFEQVIPASAFIGRQDRVKVVQWREIGGEHNR